MNLSLRVLVADDPNTHPFYQHLLRTLGHQAFSVRPGDQLLDSCRLLHPDLVVAAGAQPDPDGIAVAESICREQPTPIILVPVHHDAGLVRRVTANDCILACLFKPLAEAGLDAAIAVAMRLFERFRSLRQEIAGLQQTLEDRKRIEKAKGLVMKYARTDQEEAYRRLQELAAEQNRSLAEVAQTVITAGELYHGLDGPRELEHVEDRPTLRRQGFRRISAKRLHAEPHVDPA